MMSLLAIVWYITLGAHDMIINIIDEWRAILTNWTWGNVTIWQFLCARASVKRYLNNNTDTVNMTLKLRPRCTEQMQEKYVIIYRR